MKLSISADGSVDRVDRVRHRAFASTSIVPFVLAACFGATAAVGQDAAQTTPAAASTPSSPDQEAAGQAGPEARGQAGPAANGQPAPPAAASLPESPPPATAVADQGVTPGGTTELAASAPDKPDNGEVVVTGTRVVRNGYSAPTPVTVIGAQQVNSAAEPTIFNVVNQLPALGGSASPQTGNSGSSAGTGGLSALGLRGLGTNRTLVLVDGQRIIGASLTGVVDVSELPQQLISRVDIVTGGASADWGSDAVAGVVNFVTDKKFTGIKGDFSGGETNYSDDKQYRIALTAGTSFADGRGHFVFSGEYAHQDGVHGADRPWYKGSKVLTKSIAGTAPGDPQYIVADHVADIQLAPGGIITAGPLAGTAFGAGGVPFQFQYGNPVITPFMVGGDQSADIGHIAWLDDELTRKTLYGRASFDLTDNINVWVAGNFGRVFTHYAAADVYRTGNITIQKDNAFLPASIVAAMTADHINSFQMGSSNQDIGPFQVSNMRTMKRATAGADGSFTLFGHEWKWDSYVEFASNRIHNYNPNEVIVPYYNQAIDSVRNAAGQIVCRSTLTHPNDGCVPLNILGTGVASKEALNYVLGTPYLYTTQHQTAASLSFSGEPFSLWAGPVSIATGAEYRKESFHSNADPISEGNNGNPLFAATGNNWFTGNFHGSRGTFNVYEGFLETVIPLLKSEKLGNADLNAAARATQYSTAGYVTTWKLGLTYSPIPDIRLRATRSRDIRAPNLGELFAAATVQTQTVIDDFAPYAGQTFTIQRPIIGNTALKPEIADSWEAGIVLQPEFLRGFHASFDYYQIKIANVISSLSNQQTMDLCFLGNQSLCNLIVRNAAGQVTSLTVQSINLALQRNRGFDIETDYAFKALGGSVNLRALFTRTIENSTNSGIPNSPIVDIAGQNSGSTPNWRGLVTQTFSTDDTRFDATLTERWFSAGTLNNLWIQCTSNCPTTTVNNPTVNNNHVAGALYFDLALGYKFRTGNKGFRPEIYAKIDNIFNKDPAVVAASGSLAMINPGVNPTLYDTLGRVYHVGVRFNF